jgi:hypothetical protein
MLGVLLLFSLILAALAVARWRGFTVGRILRCLLAALLGGALGAAPGVYLYLGATVFHATGTGQLPLYQSGEMPLVLFFVGGAVGPAAALLVLDRLTRRWVRAARAVVAGLLAFAAGWLAAYFALLLGQQSPYELTILILSPVSVAAEMVAGYALLADRP